MDRSNNIPDLLEVWDKLNTYSSSNHLQSFLNLFNTFKNQSLKTIIISLNEELEELLIHLPSEYILLLVDLAKTKNNILKYRLRVLSSLATAIVLLQVYFKINFLEIEWLILDSGIGLIGFVFNLSHLLIAVPSIMFYVFFHLKNLSLINYLEATAAIRKAEEIQIEQNQIDDSQEIESC